MTVDMSHSGSNNTNYGSLPKEYAIIIFTSVVAADGQKAAVAPAEEVVSEIDTTDPRLACKRPDVGYVKSSNRSKESGVGEAFAFMVARDDV